MVLVGKTGQTSGESSSYVCMLQTLSTEKINSSTCHVHQGPTDPGRRGYP